MERDGSAFVRIRPYSIEVAYVEFERLLVLHRERLKYLSQLLERCQTVDPQFDVSKQIVHVRANQLHQA